MTAPPCSSAEDSGDSTRKGKAAVNAFLVACLAVIVLAVLARIVLDRVQEPVDRAFTTPYTRVGD